jgi:glucose dehydrogenase
MILAELEIDGRRRKVVMHAPKNGFFFVVDRQTGEFISARNFTAVNWATGYDNEGRPVENPAARSADQPFEAIPTAYGARNWHPMSFNPMTGLVYMPVHGVPMTLSPDQGWRMNANSPMRFQRPGPSAGSSPGTRCASGRPGASTMAGRGTGAR